MNILLDTHIAIWAITDDRRLTKKARDIILDPISNLYYSAASVLEVDLKTKSRNSILWILAFGNKNNLQYETINKKSFFKKHLPFVEN